jgi:hypothetical protein
MKINTLKTRAIFQSNWARKMAAQTRAPNNHGLQIQAIPASTFSLQRFTTPCAENQFSL